MADRSSHLAQERRAPLGCTGKALQEWLAVALVAHHSPSATRVAEALTPLGFGLRIWVFLRPSWPTDRQGNLLWDAPAWRQCPSELGRGSQVPASGLSAVDVCMLNVRIGLAVVRGRNWRTGKNGWNDDQKRPGTVIGFSNNDGDLVGKNASLRCNYDKFHMESGTRRTTVGPGWCAVRWDAGRQCIYPIGASMPLGKWWTSRAGGPCFSLALASLSQNPSVHIQEVKHADSAAVISPEEASTIEAVQWSQRVERSINEFPGLASNGHNSQVSGELSVTADDTASLATEISTVSLISACGSQKCFLAGTLLKSPGNAWFPVEEAEAGRVVLSSDGEALQITTVHRRASSRITVVELGTPSTSSIQFTASHRILTALGPVPASRLNIGDRVLVTGNQPEKLIQAHTFDAVEDIYELAFSPDRPVESLRPPPRQILSMGAGTPNGMSQPPRRRTRRPGMNRRLQRQEDGQASIPETYDPFET